VTLLSVLRLGGVALNTKSVSKFNTLYNVLCALCAYLILLCVVMDAYVHRYDLVQAMKKTRAVFAMLLVVWIHFSLRYVTLQ
jgi:hypothetical protein